MRTWKANPYAFETLSRHKDPLRDVSLVIFDFDGVIVDSEVISLSTLHETLIECNVKMPMSEVRSAFLGKSRPSILQVLETEHPTARLDDLLTIWELKLFSRFRESLHSIPLIEPVLDMLISLGIQYCIASSSSPVRVELALEAVSLKSRFSYIFSAESVKRGKPSPDLFLHAAQQLGVSVHNCLVIEDSPFGVRAAAAAGIRCIAFVGGSHLSGIRDEHARELHALGAEACLRHYDELLHYRHGA